VKTLKHIFALLLLAATGFAFAFGDSETVAATMASAVPISFALEKERKMFNALRAVAKQGYNPMQTTLWIENQISNNKSTYVFDPRSAGSNTNGNLPQQVLLDKEDLLIVTAIGLFIYEADTTNDSTLAKVSKGLQTYPNSGYFTAGTDFAPNDLFQLYAGTLQCKVGTNVILENLSMDEALVIPEKQIGDPATALYSERKPGDGFVVMPTNLLLDGNSDNKFTLNCPTFDGIEWEQDADNTAVKVVLRARGLNIKGGSAIRKEIMELLGTINY